MNVSRVYITKCSKVRMKYLILGVFIALLYFGAFTHIFEVDFYEHFSYPLDGDIRQYVELLKRKEQPNVEKINVYNYSFVSTCNRKCKTSDKERLRLVYIIKSAPHHFDRRVAIRNSWGYERRFSDVPIRTIFVLGVVLDNSHLQMEIDEERNKYGDIVQAEFVDTYFNNTIKTMMGFKWAVQFCLNSKFYMFSDDDMYISTKNVLQFIRNPTQYPEYLQTPVYSLKQRKKRALDKGNRDYFSSFPLIQRHINQVMDFELPEDAVLFAGYVFISAPHRHLTSK
ncbi:beta-1,3-galactosyltransferase brn-like [Anabrus simplex]|uniref:beta-1,3-galactosyltransferase brn-like n=1 Tax=Anabrus simplex TaxID=316456 RepID=UPI0035A3804D